MTTVPCGAGASPPLGILTQAYRAHLDAAAAFPRLSVYEGERISIEIEGRLGLHVGNATLAFSENSSATLQRIDHGAHVDMTSGTLYFASPEKGVVEVHAAEAFLRPDSSQPTQAEISILAPKVLQIAARHGNLSFSYKREFQVLPEGETYRIYLDAPAEPQNPAGAGAPAASRTAKVAFFIVAGAAATGLAVWGIHELIVSGNGIESPAKP